MRFMLNKDKLYHAQQRKKKKHNDMMTQENQ